MRNKKAQVTWFIIMGIVVLLGVGTVVYVRQTTEKGEIEQIPAGREVRYEGEQEIRNFVDSCLKPIVLQGLEIQRLQGGFIEIPAGRDILIIKDKEENEQIKLIDNSKNVYIDATGQGNDAPYWITKYGIAIPSKEFMESELEVYVTKELDKCVGDFKQFQDMGFKIEKGAITTDVSFAKSTWVSVKLPLIIAIHEITYEISDFNIEIPINMELIYNIASDLSLYQDLYAYLEGFTLDIIEKYSWRGGSKAQPHYLPPKRFTTAGFDCSQTTWTLEEVKNKLKDNYNRNFEYLKIANTNFERVIRQDPIEQGVFDGYIYDLFEEQYPSIHADYVYDPDWFFNLDILPRSGFIIKPDRTTALGIPLMPRLCTFKYRFNYFYDFPVLLKVKDDKSAKIDPVSNTFEKEAGYEFHVPLWVFVCGNQKRECTGRARTFETESEIEETAFCDDSQKLSGDITINVKDRDKPVEGVDIYYFGANSMQNCFIGRTSAEGTFTSKFPFCDGCSIQLFKQSYPVKKQRFDVLDYEDKTITFNLAPFVNLTVNVKLIDMKTFVRSWHETDNFTNAEKMIDLAAEYGYDTSTLNPNLNELKNNKGLMGALLGESDLNNVYNDKALITGTGLDQFYYMYPDPYNAKLKLGSGTYDISMGVTGNVYIKNTTMPSAPVLREIYPLSPDISYTWEVPDLTNKDNVIFYSLVEHTSTELNPGEWSMIIDPITQNETMKAELLYQATPIYKHGKIRGCRDDLRFSKIDGRNNKDLYGGACREVYDIDITKEEYLPYITPEIR